MFNLAKVGCFPPIVKKLTTQNQHVPFFHPKMRTVENSVENFVPFRSDPIHIPIRSVEKRIVLFFEPVENFFALVENFFTAVENSVENFLSLQIIKRILTTPF
jgi:hypothetical protein